MKEVSFLPDRLWGEACKGPLVVSHKDMVLNCPPGFLLRGSSQDVPIEALAHESLPVWTFQSHPEATPGFIKNNAIPGTDKPAHSNFGLKLVSQFFRFAARK